MTATLMVTYAGSSNTPFDRQYYVDKHLPLVRESWGQHGLQSVAAFFPLGDGGGTIAICLCHFESEQAIDVALQSPQSPRVMKDVKQFTDVTPTQSRLVAIRQG